MPDADEQHQHLAAALIHAADACKRSFARAVEGHGLTHTQARALFALDEPQPMSALAEVLSCDASNVTLVADQLEQLGLAERRPASDRRVKLLALTDLGATRRDEVGASVSAQSFPSSRLDASERTTLLGLLERLLGPDAD